ncbi:DUF4834 family protein [Flavobacterium sp.]|uniref:DUF4834 family protein n=1 Tax=Flavobacterium sp. TaxID=239 RepID=UPI0037539A55
MQQASPYGFLKVILGIFAFYYIFKFLARLFLPVLAKKMVTKAQEHFENQIKNQQTNQHQNTNQTTVNSKSDKPRETKKVGEYVDYEEID